MVSPGPPKSATLHMPLTLCFHLLYRQGKEFHNSKWASFSEMESADAGQIHADEGKDKHRSWERPCLARRSRVVEALVPGPVRARRLAKHLLQRRRSPVRSVSGARTSICVHLSICGLLWHSPDAQVFQERGTAHGNAYLAHRRCCSGSGRPPEPAPRPLQAKEGDATLNSQLSTA